MNEATAAADGLRMQTAGSVFRRALMSHWLVYLVGTFALLVTSVSEALAPKFVQWALDVIAPKSTELAVPRFLLRPSRLETLYGVVSALCAFLVLGWVGRFFWRQTLARRSHQAGRDLKTGMWDVLRHVPLRTFHRYPLGDLMNRAIGDLQAGRSIHGFTIVLTFDMVFFAVLAAAAMFMIDAELALYCLAVFPLLPRYIVRLAKREYVQHVYAQEKLSSLSDLISQCLSAIRLQRSTASHDAWIHALTGEAQEYAKRRFEVLRTGLKMFPLGAVPTLIAYAILLYWGVQKIQNGSITIGEFVALQSYVLLMQTPLFELGDVISEWQRGFASLHRIVEVFNLRGRTPRYGLEQLSVSAVPASETAIEARRLTVCFDPSSRAVLSDVTFSVRSRERIGICGPIGAGKTTLLRAISGLIEIPPGQLQLFGHDAMTAGRKFVTEHVAMVPQRAFLFAGSVRYNLVLNEAFSDAELWNVLRIVNLADDIRSFPNGLETWIGEWGINLSGGQKQRLSLARALLRPKPLLLLDDCLSAVDAVTEEQILSAMDAALHDKTIVWVAHRKSTLKLCDVVYVLDAGAIVQTMAMGPEGDEVEIP